MKKTFTFNNPQDMINLARFIQDKVYFGSSFHVTEDGEDGDANSYSYLWKLCDEMYAKGYNAVEIEDDKYVRFIR